MRSGNPALTEKTFLGHEATAERMTLGGAVARTALLLVILTLGAAIAWNEFSATGVVPRWALWGSLVALGLAIGIVVRPTLAPTLAPLYALAQGVAVGAISALFETRFPGIVLQAVGLTFGTLAALLLAYRSGLIKPSENFRLGLAAATGAIALLYLVSFVMGFFGKSIPLIHSAGPWGIGFSVVVVGIAALNLVLDFDFIEEGARAGAPKYMEWYAAFGLMVTLVWLYLEILRLLAKLRSSDD